MTKNKIISSLKNFKRGFFKKSEAVKESFITDYRPFLKSLLPQILIIFGCCLYVSLGLFSAAVLGRLSINHENTPRFICCYAFIYFSVFIWLLAAEYRTKKNWHFISYILFTTPVNLIIVLFLNPQVVFNFFGRLFPQVLLLTVGAFIFYIADYNPRTVKKNKKTPK